MNTIKCFGVAREIMDKSDSSIEIDGITVGELRNRINEKYPEFMKIKGYMIAVNQVYALDTQVLSNNDEVAIIPPVSGG